MFSTRKDTIPRIRVLGLEGAGPVTWEETEAERQGTCLPQVAAPAPCGTLLLTLRGPPKEMLELRVDGSLSWTGSLRHTGQVARIGGGGWGEKERKARQASWLHVTQTQLELTKERRKVEYLCPPNGLPGGLGCSCLGRRQDQDSVRRQLRSLCKNGKFWMWIRPVPPNLFPSLPRGWTSHLCPDAFPTRHR